MGVKHGDMSTVCRLGWDIHRPEEPSDAMVDGYIEAHGFNVVRKRHY
jgi:hypothetical protein